MARIKHVAIATQDPEATAKFYVEGLGLEIAGKVNSVAAEGYYLTDGYINLAVLKFKNDDAANTEGKARHTGLHHFGFMVEEMDQAQEQILGAGATKKQSAITDANAHARTGNVEVKFTGPDGITVDLSETGWAGASKD
jgi:catechol 2,3-dioxygenase-like lactoylglutathione lyase family enzyme